MTISIDKIDIIIERAEVGYKEARDVLEKFDGNIVESLIYLETKDKTTSYQAQEKAVDQGKRVYNDKIKAEPSFLDKIKSFIQKLHKTKFTLLKAEKTIINLPMTLAIILAIASMPFSIILLLVAIVTGHKIAIIKANGDNIKASEALHFVEKQQEKYNKEDLG